MIDRLLAAGLILGIIIIVVAATAYDPAVEVLPGRTMPQSQAERTLAVWDIREAKWINPNPKFPEYEPFNYRSVP
jgi:hypothetical protein